jgi:16S rRNA C1402 (ribose-2'-O) methylase RsmI
MLKKLLPHMPLKTAAQLVADWTGLKKNDLYQQGLDFRAALE